MAIPTKLKPLPALAAGTAGVLLIGAGLVPFGPELPRSIHALLLMIPVVIAGVLGGRAVAIAMTVEAALMLALFLPPLGSPAVQLSDDLVVMLLFVVVAASLGGLVANALTSERRRAAAEHQRLEALESIEQQRKALMRSVSHDLRTPLATIRAAAGDLSGGLDYDDATRAEIFDLMISEVERLDRIVANLLSLSRVEAGALLPERHPAELEELVRASADRLRRVTQDLDVQFVVADDLPLVDVDYSQMDQVVTNLLENAARHSPPEGTILVELSPLASELRLVVSDEGPGLPPELRDRVFEPFAAANGSGSSGIGLAICRAIVEAHDGSISAGTTAEGGARLTVRLPAHA